MMNIGKKPKDPFVYRLLSAEQVKQIDEYIHDPMTATVFSKEEEKEATKDSSRDKFVTSEEIYYWTYGFIDEMLSRNPTARFRTVSPIDKNNNIYSTFNVIVSPYKSYLSFFVNYFIVPRT